MSKQSDVELLAIQAVEKYAKDKNIPAQEVIKIFHKCNVFEEMLVQHEYLHQVGFDEVFEFVEKIIKEESQEVVVYHGTVEWFENILLEKSKNRRDFGRGFYTTVLESQAKEWAYRLSLREKKSTYYVYEYSLAGTEKVKIKRFDSINLEWLELIKNNRSKGGLQHNYDIVIGPVADDNTMETVQLYMAGVLNGNEAMERLRYSRVNNQVSFHSEVAIQCLKLIRRTRYE